MAEKRSQEEVGEEVSYKRPCVENKNTSDSEIGDHYEREAAEVLPGPASWGSQASSSDSSGSSSSSGASGPRPGVGDDSSSEGSASDSLDMGLGGIQPESLPGPMGWLQKQMMSGVDPRTILVRIIPSGMSIPDEMDEFEMWSIIAEYLRSIDEPPPRHKLEQHNTFEDAIRLLRSCRNVLVLTGAGVSVSCGIPDFRSRDGVYARLAVDFPDLPDPQAMFEISYFRRDPRPFFKFAKELFPGQFKPSTSHKFISQLEHHGKLLRNYTQNIDTLEQAAGISRVIQCHGSFATASCTRCSFSVDSDFIREDIFNQVVPVCPQCGPDTPEMAVLKPDIVFFGEGLPNHFYDKLDDDKESADLLIVMGSSLKVRPVATIPSMLPKNVPQILINREPLRHLTFDIELLGDCDVIINEILHRLGDGWNHACQSQARLEETSDVPDIPRCVRSESAEGSSAGLSSAEGKIEAKQSKDALPPESEKVREESLAGPSRVTHGSRMGTSQECVDVKSAVSSAAAAMDGSETNERFAITPPLQDISVCEEKEGHVVRKPGVVLDGAKSEESASHRITKTSGIRRDDGKHSSPGENESVNRTCNESGLTHNHSQAHSGVVEPQSNSASAIAAETDTTSCLKAASGDSSTSRDDKHDIHHGHEINSARKDRTTSCDTPPLPHPDRETPRSDECQSLHDKMRHHENAASEYMQFQRMLDSSSHGMPHTSCEATDSRYLTEGKRKKQHTEHAKPEHSRAACKGGSERSDGDSVSRMEHAVSRAEDSVRADRGRTSPDVGRTDRAKSGDRPRDEASPSPTPESRPAPSTSATERSSRETVATLLKESTFLFIPPCRYVFHGAEVYLASDSESEVGNDFHDDLDMGELHDDLESGGGGDDLPSSLGNGELPGVEHRDGASAKTDPLPDLLNGSPSPLAANHTGSNQLEERPTTKAPACTAVNGIACSPFEAPPPSSLHGTDSHLENLE